jgi:RNA polymerase sigma-70 factor, ECF subfamily
MTPTTFRELVEATAPDLLAYFERRVMPADAADLLGETLLVIWRRKDSVPDDSERFRMWAFGVARKVLSTHWRGRSRRVALADRLRSVLISQTASSTESDLDVRAAIAALPDAERELVRLVHWEQFTVADAARVLGINASTARSRYAAAKERLRDALA